MPGREIICIGGQLHTVLGELLKGALQPLLQRRLVEMRQRDAHIHPLDELFPLGQARFVGGVKMEVIASRRTRQGWALVAEGASRTISSAVA